MRSLAHIVDEPEQSALATAWGDQLCVIRCSRLAEALYDGRPVCLPCAEDLLDRDIAREILRDTPAARAAEAKKQAALERAAYYLRGVGL